MKKKSTHFLVEGAIIAGIYAALTYVAATIGLAYGPLQFRFSEALTVLAAFTPAAIPGLTTGFSLACYGAYKAISDANKLHETNISNVDGTNGLELMCYGVLIELCAFPNMFMAKNNIKQGINHYNSRFNHVGLNTVKLNLVVNPNGLGLRINF